MWCVNPVWSAGSGVLQGTRVEQEWPLLCWRTVMDWTERDSTVICVSLFLHTHGPGFWECRYTLLLISTASDTSWYIRQTNRPKFWKCTCMKPAVFWLWPLLSTGINYSLKCVQIENNSFFSNCTLFAVLRITYFVNNCITSKFLVKNYNANDCTKTVHQSENQNKLIAPKVPWSAPYAIKPLTYYECIFFNK